MLGIDTNDADNPVSLDYLAFVANWFNTCPDFHPLSPSPALKSPTIKTNLKHLVNQIPKQVSKPALLEQRLL